MHIVKVESAFKLIAIKMPITITLLNLFASLLFALLHVFISINCNALVGSAQCSIYSHSVHSI